MKPSKSNSKKRGKKKRKPSSPSPPQIQNPSPADALSSAPAFIDADGEDRARRALDLDWLMGAFSSLSFGQIVTAYDDTWQDPFKAAGILASQLTDSGDIGVNKNHTKKGAEERKQKRVAASTGIVANVIGKGYAKPSSHRGKKTWNETDMQYSMCEGEEFLCSMLGDNSELGMGVVKDVLYQCGYDVEKALDALLNISACSLNRFMDRGSGNCSCTYPELSSEGFADNDIDSLQIYGAMCSCLFSNTPCQSTTDSSDSAYHPSVKENDIPHYEEYGCRGDTIYIANAEEQPSSGSRAINPELQQKVLESLFKIPQNRIHEPNGMNWKKVVQQVESFGKGLEYRNGNVTEPLLNATYGKEDEYQVCRSVARKHWDNMKTCYQKAAMEYSKGQRAHAAQLSATGRIHGNLARKADEKASREIFQARNKDITNTVTIDLHGQHVKQGIGLLKLHLLLFTYIPSVQFLKVITGCGGDGTGKGILKHSVIALVKREGIEWCEENSGTLLLRLDGLKEYSFTEEEDPDEN